MIQLPVSSSRTAMSARIGTLACVVGVAACASGGGSQTSVASVPTAQVSQDSVRAVDLNARLRAAAMRDSVSLALSRQDSVYRVGPNDQIEITVFNAADFSGSHRVDESGEISIPLLGSVMAAGRTLRELETELERQLGATYMHDPHVSIQVTEIQSHGVSVVGAVRTPGVYQISGPSSLLELLAMAEGLTPEAGSEVFVIRARSRSFDPSRVDPSDPSGVADFTAGAEAIRVDLGSLLESGEASQNVLVLPGDIVQVRPAGLVYVVGQVNQPGGFTLPSGEPLTVLQALAMAEGLGRTALASRSVIVREDAYGARTEVPVDLQAVLEGEVDPPLMNPRDVLFVPNNDAKSFGLGVVNALVSMVSLRGLFF